MTPALRPRPAVSARLLRLVLASALGCVALGAAAQAPGAASAPAAGGSAAAAGNAAAAAPATGAPAKPDLTRGASIATAVCGACHLVDGNRGTPANPIIAGQHADYLVKQLVEFKTDKRPSAVMKAMAMALNESDMRSVSAFYASKSAKTGFAKNKDLATLGERIWRGGIPEKGVPSCSGCHGPAGAGIPAQYPKLAGQHADYLEAQLVNFRSNARPNSPIMTGIAARMSDREIKAVADYSAGLR